MLARFIFSHAEELLLKFPFQEQYRLLDGFALMVKHKQKACDL